MADNKFGDKSVTTDGMPVVFDGQGWISQRDFDDSQLKTSPSSMGEMWDVAKKFPMSLAKDTKNFVNNNREISGGLAGGTIASMFMAPETGGGSLLIPILGAMLGGGIGNAYDQEKAGVKRGPQESPADPTEVGMGALRQGGWEGVGQIPNLLKLLGVDSRLYRSTGRFNPMAPKGQTEDAVKFGLQHNIVLPSGAEKAGIEANNRTNQAVKDATAKRPQVSGLLTAGTQPHLAGSEGPSVGGGRGATQDAQITNRLNDIIGVNGVPRVNTQFSGETVGNAAKGIEQRQAIGDEMRGAGTIQIPRNPFENPGTGSPLGMVNPTRVVNTGLKDFKVELNQRGHNKTALNQLQDLIDQFYAEKGGRPLSYEDLNTLRQREQNLGKAFYNSEGKIADPSNDIRAGYHAGVGSGASQILKEDIPATAQSLKDTQDSIYLQRGITPTTEAAKGSVPFVNALGGPMRGLLGPGTFALAHYGTGMGMLPSALAGMGLWLGTSPEALRTMAIGINKGAKFAPTAGRAAHTAEAIALQDALNADNR